MKTFFVTKKHIFVWNQPSWTKCPSTHIMPPGVYLMKYRTKKNIVLSKITKQDLHLRIFYFDKMSLMLMPNIIKF